MDFEKIALRAKELAKLEHNSHVNYGKDVIKLKDENNSVELILSKVKDFAKNRARPGTNKETHGLVQKIPDSIVLVNSQNRKNTYWDYITFPNLSIKEKFMLQVEEFA